MFRRLAILLAPLIDVIAFCALIGAGVSLRVELGALAYPLVDQYRDADGMDLGRSPRLTLSVGLGLDVALGSQKD